MKLSEVYCPTALGSVLLRIYLLENHTDQAENVDFEDMTWWWTDKMGDPESQDHWLDENLWRVLARHLHAVITVNSPLNSDVFGFLMGIDSPLPEPLQTRVKQENPSDTWSLPDCRNAMPPFEFNQWQKPLEVARNTLNNMANMLI